MITRIELDGFKTFHGFKLDLAPFQVIVGANGAGKSNLFDALRLLSRLADEDLRTAFHALRGEPEELFTTYPGGQSSDRMDLNVEMLVDGKIEDEWGETTQLKYTRLRYELRIVRRRDERGLERLYIEAESLRHKPKGSDTWMREHAPGTKDLWQPRTTGGRVPFISTETQHGKTTISVHQDKHGGRRKQNIAEKAERTVLSGVVGTEYPHAFAVREEMRSWRFLQLNPEALREPSPMAYVDASMAPDGSRLPNALARMASEDGYILNDVSRDLANLVPGVTSVTVEKDEKRELYTVCATMQDGRSFSSRVLSDGTLRMLALATLKHDPEHRGVLCFEEPENGVHPFRLKNLVALLRELATDLGIASEAEPLRQLLVNTHSPVLVKQLWPRSAPDVLSIPGLLFAHMTTRVVPHGSEPVRQTRMVPVGTSAQSFMDSEIDSTERDYTAGQVLRYLDTADRGEAATEPEREGALR